MYMTAYMTGEIEQTCVMSAIIATRDRELILMNNFCYHRM